MEFFKYIHAVGTGPKSNRDLTYEESEKMMTLILEGKVYPEQISAFLLGWRMKPETIEEFRGVVSACDKYIKKTPVKNSIELGYPFDGKVKNPYIFPLVAKELERFGLNLVIAGDVNQSIKQGIAPKDIASHMSLPSNMYYFDREDFFKELHLITDTRIKLGLRSGINTIEKLPNVGESEYAITGVFHKPYVEKYSKIFSDKYKRLALIQGNEGTPELFSKGRLWIVENGETEEYIIDPAEYGIEYEKSWDTITMEESLEQLKNPTDSYLQLARLNAAVYLFVVEKASSIQEAYEMLNS